MRYIGIDPDVEKSGLAVWNGSTKTLEFCGTKTFFELIGMLDGVIGEDNGGYEIHIEAGFLNKKSNFHPAQGAAVREKIAKMVGRCEMVSLLLIEFCESNKIKYKAIRPTRTKDQNNFIFKQVKWEGRSNQEMRDAAALVIGL